MNLKLDIYDYSEYHALPDRMEKFASAVGGTKLLPKDKLSILPDSDFALIIKEGNVKHRKFPIVDQTHSLVSGLFFNQTKDKLPNYIRNKVAVNIIAGIAGQSAGENEFNINDITENTVEKQASARVKARIELKDSDYALVIKEGNVKRRLYPIHNEEMCKLAADYYNKYWRMIPPDYRFKFAKALITKINQQQFNIKISKEMRKYYSPVLNDALSGAIHARLKLVNDEQVKLAYKTLLKNATKDTTEKIATILREIDKQANLDNNTNIPDAYESVFCAIEPKVESEKTAEVSIVGEYQFDPNTLKTVPYEKIQHIVSPDIYEGLQADPVGGFNSLPPIYKQQIQDALQ